MRQKSKNIFTLPLAAVTALLLVTGCDKQAADAPVTGFPEDGVVRVSTGGAATRADGESLYLGTNLGLFIDYGTDDRFSMRNVRWDKNASDWTPGTQMLWKDATTPAKLYAYAPYVATVYSSRPVVVFKIPSDQTSGTTEADLVFWKNEAFAPNDSNVEFVDGKVLISFSHALTKLTLNFEKAGQFASDVTVEKVVLKDTRPSIDFDLANEKVVAYSGGAGDISMHKLGDLQYEAVFYPGSGQLGYSKMLEVTMSDGTILFYNVPAGGLVSGGLQLGKSYSMKMTLGKDKIEVIDDIRVVDWTAGDPFESSEAELGADVWDGSVATSFESGRGTEADPYIIAKASQLAYLAESVNNGEPYSGKYLKLTSDLVLANRPWTPIGNSANSFSGHFDGDGKGIYGLNVNSTVWRVGLFGSAKNGAVIENCSVRGRVETTGTYAGGIVGELGESTVAGCTAEVSVKGASNVGGICGHSYLGGIIRCHTVNCHVEGSEHSIGGIVGIMEGMRYSGKVEECTAEGTVKGVNKVGGICGWLNNSCVVLSGCSAHVDISARGDCGGLVGYINETPEFIDCGFDGTITKTGYGSFGAAVGVDKSKAAFTNCWYNADKTGDLLAVGASEGDAAGKDYSGIEAKHLGK